MKTLMNKLCFVKDGTRVSFDFYMLGMESEDMDGRARAQERTSVMTNSPMLAERLSGYQCDKKYRHVVLMNGLAQKCQIYPDEFCKLVCEEVLADKPQSLEQSNPKYVTWEMNVLMS